jgi:ribA/ribD-fused uncharacterized protein
MVKLEQYRDTWLAEKFDEFIGFYPREFACFDNFSAFKVKHNEVEYSTLEHAYQALKFIKTSEEVYNKIVNCYSSHEAQKIAFANKDKVDPEWEDVKLDIMKKLVMLKAEQNPYVVRKLLQTKDYMIVEDSPKDGFWGIGQDRKGQNNLGKIWMKVREIYFNKN